MMKLRFNKLKIILDVVICAVSVMLSIGMMIYGIFYFGLGSEYSRIDLVLNIFYIACVVMIWMYFFNIYITTNQFNYWCSVCVGMTVLIRDILFLAPMENQLIRMATLTLSVLLLCMLTYFYARKEWKTYTKLNLWMIFLVDVLIALLYNIEIYLEPEDEYTEFFLTEIWIRPTITYGLVACFVSETEEQG